MSFLCRAIWFFCITNHANMLDWTLNNHLLTRFSLFYESRFTGPTQTMKENAIIQRAHQNRRRGLARSCEDRPWTHQSALPQFRLQHVLQREGHDVVEVLHLKRMRADGKKRRSDRFPGQRAAAGLISEEQHKRTPPCAHATLRTRPRALLFPC